MRASQAAEPSLSDEHTGQGAAPQSSLRSDVALMFANKSLHLFLNLVTAVVLARALGVSGRGELAVAIAFSTTLLQVGTFGLIGANTYFVARDARTVARVAANSLWFAGALGLVLVAAGAFVKAEFPWIVAGIGWQEVLAVLVGIPAALATVFLQAVLLGEGRMVPYNLVEIAHGVLITAVLTVALFAFDVGVLGALVVMTVFYYAAALVYLMLLMRHAPPLATPDLALAREMLRFAGRVYLVTLVAFLVIRLDLLLVNSYLGSVEAGLYSVVAALVEGMTLLPVVIGTNLFPRVSRGAGVEFTASVFRNMTVLFGLFCVVSVPLAAPGIRLLFGESFEGAVDLYYWIVPGIFSLGMLTILSNHFAGRGYPRMVMVLWVAALALNLVMNVVLLPDHGTYIASLASSVTYGLLLVTHVRLFAKESGGYGILVPRLDQTALFVRDMVRRRPA